MLLCSSLFWISNAPMMRVLGSLFLFLFSFSCQCDSFSLAVLDALLRQLLAVGGIVGHLSAAIGSAILSDMIRVLGRPFLDVGALASTT